MAAQKTPVEMVMTIQVQNPVLRSRFSILDFGCWLILANKLDAVTAD